MGMVCVCVCEWLYEEDWRAEERSERTVQGCGGRGGEKSVVAGRGGGLG